MSYYHTCPDCGANLDPGETCDCKNKRLTTPWGGLATPYHYPGKSEADIFHGAILKIAELAKRLAVYENAEEGIIGIHPSPKRK